MTRFGAIRRHALRRSEEAGRRSGRRRARAHPERYSEIMAETGYVARVHEGAKRITPIAAETVQRVKKAMGFIHGRKWCRSRLANR